MYQFVAFLLLFLSLAFSQKTLAQSKGSPELIQPSIYATDSEVIAKVQGQLLGAITLLDALQDGTVKLLEKRRNKFEFIRFGRR
uniref:FMRFamide-related peptide FLP-12 n=1 Tax=Ascaris suum TaxID=6253 RepID=Q6V7W8_ASCSU|nr:FMRFamide-related peptide FLP-12 precursor [Ascaris suum]